MYAGAGPPQPPQPYPNGYGHPPYGQPLPQHPYPPPASQPPYPHPYPSQPYGQPGYPPPPHGGPPSHQGPPPPGPPSHRRLSKKGKGGPVVTRYAPPPGYQPPQQPPQGGYYPQQGYPPHGQPPPPSYYPPQSGYPYPQGYQQGPHTQAQGYPPAPAYQHGPGYAPQPPYPPPQGHPPQHPDYHHSHGYPPNSYPPQGPPPPAPYPQGPPAPPHAQPERFGQYPPPHGPPAHSSRPYPEPALREPSPVPSVVKSEPGDAKGRKSVASSQNASDAMDLERSEEKPPADEEDGGWEPTRKPIVTPDPAGLAEHDWDLDFDGPLWPKADEPVDQTFSLGQIIWHPSERTRRCMPADFFEAEELATKDLPPVPPDAPPTMSRYFERLEDRRGIFHCSVHETEEWEYLKNDPVFRTFERPWRMISIYDVLASRNRPDEPEEMEDSQQSIDRSWVPPRPVDFRPDGASDGTKIYGPNSNEAHGDTRMDICGEITPPPSAAPETTRHNSKEREDILAKLGVTGSPKPVYPTPSPAFLPPSMSTSGEHRPKARPEPPLERRSFTSSSPTNIRDRPRPPLGGSSRSGSFGNHRSPPQPPPPPPPEHRHSYDDPWSAHSGYQSRQRSPSVHSNGSAHTMAGSDFGGEGPVAVPPLPSAKDAAPATKAEWSGSRNGSTSTGTSSARPSISRKESFAGRKRSLNDANAEDEDDEIERRQHEEKQRAKRRQSRVAEAYSRRW
ncbi:hypothetical protein BDY21DRAFT_199717 [Lineolata rhizophorae]|uniref:Uncharacterized protein n=1 Tax=Lineolata rhizophorae TaxID=578093 RepID=A0A6A6P5L9_9PEZI|nr:hypothetical protein BDY21DRAFT_199717 [Lineolata rhizophorae]